MNKNNIVKEIIVGFATLIILIGVFLVGKDVVKWIYWETDFSSIMYGFCIFLACLIICWIVGIMIYSTGVLDEVEE